MCYGSGPTEVESPPPLRFESSPDDPLPDTPETAPEPSFAPGAFEKRMTGGGPGQARFSATGPVTHSAVRLIATLEATSFLILLACMVLKYSGPKIDWPVMIMGWIHGLLFLAFLWVIFRARSTLGWTRKRTWLAVGSSVVPIAPYFVAHTETEDEPVS